MWWYIQWLFHYRSWRREKVERLSVVPHNSNTGFASNFLQKMSLIKKQTSHKVWRKNKTSVPIVVMPCILKRGSERERKKAQMRKNGLGKMRPFAIPYGNVFWKYVHGLYIAYIASIAKIYEYAKETKYKLCAMIDFAKTLTIANLQEMFPKTVKAVLII